MLVKKTASCLQMLEWFEANHQIVDKIIEQLDFDINATTGGDDYSVGLRNGLRLAKSLLNGEEPKFEHIEKDAN